MGVCFHWGWDHRPASESISNCQANIHRTWECLRNGMNGLTVKVLEVGDQLALTVFLANWRGKHDSLFFVNMVMEYDIWHMTLQAKKQNWHTIWLLITFSQWMILGFISHCSSGSTIHWPLGCVSNFKLWFHKTNEASMWQAQARPRKPYENAVHRLLAKWEMPQLQQRSQQQKVEVGWS